VAARLKIEVPEPTAYCSLHSALRADYRANYAILCAGIIGIASLLQHRLLMVVGGSIALHYVGAEWDGRLPADWQTPPLRLEQRLTASLFGSVLLAHYMDATSRLMRVGILCGGLVLGHATFRARSLSARWAFFRDSVEKQD